MKTKLSFLYPSGTYFDTSAVLELSAISLAFYSFSGRRRENGQRRHLIGNRIFFPSLKKLLPLKDGAWQEGLTFTARRSKRTGETGNSRCLAGEAIFLYANAREYARKYPHVRVI